MRGVFVTGTDTDVGKTWVSQQIIKQLTKTGILVAPRKPVESGWPEDINLTDAWKLAHAAEKEDEIDIICPNRFVDPISPDRAAKLLKKPLLTSQLVEQCKTNLNTETDFLYVEGAGGFYSPLCADGQNVDLAKALKLPIILVVSDRLGCINHTLLTIEAIENNKLRLLAVVLNQTEEKRKTETNMNNYDDLSELIDYPLVMFEHSAESLESTLKICSFL